MTSEEKPRPSPALPVADVAARRRGRMGLAVPWENLPWWGIIILIVGVFVGYSVFTSARYMDALYFIFDLPWNKQPLSRLEKRDLGANGQWSLTIKPALAPGKYTLYAEFETAAGEVVGRGDVYKIEVPTGAPAVTGEPLKPSPNAFAPVQTSTPTFAGVVPAGAAVVVFYEDFSDDALRIVERIWNSNGVFMTIKTTLIAFSGALILGLIFGLMRVSPRSPNLSINAGRRLLIGAGLAILIWGLLFVIDQRLVSLPQEGAPIANLTEAIPAWRNPTTMVTAIIIIEAIMFLFPAMPYTFSTLYVEVVRGVPMLVIVLYMGFAVTPALREATRGATGKALDLQGLPAAIIGLSFGYGAYLAEVYRAGIESIPKGQMEAARSLGMGYFQAMRHIILPQAIRVVLPPLGNDFIAMLKDSSLISVIALPEVLQQGRLWISRNFRAFEGFNSVVLVYLVMTLLLSLLVRFIERKSALPGR
jgi:ABC-type amino acid transport system permease subunit